MCIKLIISMAELEVFLIILIISGYLPLLSIKHFSKNSEDLRNVAVYNSIRRNRFKYIEKILHFHGNTNLNYDDKYSKLRPLISHLQEAFMRHFIPSQEISHAEAMVEYLGKHSRIRAIRDKPIRFIRKPR